MVLRSLAASLAFVALASAQAPVGDVGMTVFFNSGPSTVMGQQCGPVVCVPLWIGPTQRGVARTFVHASAPQTPFAIGFGFPGPCLALPQVSHGLQLDSASLLVVTAGMTSHEPFVPTPCQQGIAMFTLTLPAGAPVGLVFRVQGIGQSNSGQLAFGPALESVVL